MHRARYSQERGRAGPSAVGGGLAGGGRDVASASRSLGLCLWRREEEGENGLLQDDVDVEKRKEDHDADACIRDRDRGQGLCQVQERAKRASQPGASLIKLHGMAWYGMV